MARAGAVRASIVILGIETSCDETAAAVVDRRRTRAVVGRLVAGGSPCPLRRSRARGRVAAASRARRARRARRRSTRPTPARPDRARRGDAGAGPRRGAARRHLGCKGARLGAGAAARPGRSPRGARRVALPRARRRSSRRSPACSRAAGTRCFSPSASAAARSGSARRSTTRRARRSTRVRACSGSAIRAARRSTGSRGRATRRRSTSPWRACPGLDFSFSGLKTALLYVVRDLGADGGRARGRPTSPRRTSARSCVRSSAGSARRPRSTGLARLAVVGGVAANSELRAALPDAAFAPLALCTDNAAMIASCARYVERAPVPSLPCLDAYASFASALALRSALFVALAARRRRCARTGAAGDSPSTKRVGRACSACALPSRRRSATSCS